jgi:N-methylhydantoinase B
MTKRDDHLTFDFSGSSEQSRYAINCTKWASLGGLFAPLFPLLCYDITWNEGVIKPITMIAPEGTVVNCRRPAPVSVATVGAIQSVNNAACATIGKMLALSDTYRREATAVWHANHFAIFMFGRNQHGREAIGILTETFAGSGGARTYADGIDVGGEIPNPISRMANVELIENSFPLRYLYRRLTLDSGGPGRYRGGLGMEIALQPHGAPDGGLHYVVSGKGATFPMSDGLAGGYPGAPNAYLWIKPENASARSHAPGDSVGAAGAPPGVTQAVDWGVFPLMGDDVLYVRWNGGGGVGDPLDRPAAEVLADVCDGVTSPQVAARAYGVVIEATGAGVDRAATEALRERLRAARAPRTATGSAQAAVVKCRQSSDGSGYEVACADCGERLSRDGAPWKSRAALHERTFAEIMPTYATGADLVLREFCCPRCGALLDSETALRGEPWLLDRLGTPSD